MACWRRQVIQFGRFPADGVPKPHLADHPILDEIGGQQSVDLGDVTSDEFGTVSGSVELNNGEPRSASSAHHPISHGGLMHE